MGVPEINLFATKDQVRAVPTAQKHASIGICIDPAFEMDGTSSEGGREKGGGRCRGRRC